MFDRYLGDRQRVPPTLAETGPALQAVASEHADNDRAVERLLQNLVERLDGVLS
jgi:hypothetical protein